MTSKNLNVYYLLLLYFFYHSITRLDVVRGWKKTQSVLWQSIIHYRSIRNVCMVSEMVSPTCKPLTLQIVLELVCMWLILFRFHSDVLTDVFW